MISILCPSRKRPKEFERMVASVRATSDPHYPVEIIARFDEDDVESIRAARQLEWNLKVLVGPRDRVMCRYWNECYAVSHGDIALQGNDDITFNTPGWNRIVEEEFAKCPDKILLCHGDDLLYGRERCGAHCFVSRKWVDTAGFFIPPWFESDFGDQVLNFAADQLGRRKFLSNVVIEHHHYLAKKMEYDETARQRIERHEQSRPDIIYEEKLPERLEMIRKLRAAMDPNWRLA